MMQIIACLLGAIAILALGTIAAGLAVLSAAFLWYCAVAAFTGIRDTVE